MNYVTYWTITNSLVPTISHLFNVFNNSFTFVSTFQASIKFIADISLSNVKTVSLLISRKHRLDYLNLLLIRYSCGI